MECNTQNIKMADLNGDGRLSSTEYVEAVGGVMRRAAVCAALNIDSDGAGELSAKELSHRFDRFRAKFGKLFPDGIETPSDAQFNRLSGIYQQTLEKFENFPADRVSHRLEYASLLWSTVESDADLAFAKLLEEMRRRSKSKGIAI